MARNKPSSYVFAFIHLGLVLGFLSYGIYLVVSGSISKGIIILLLLAVYYFFALHEAVKKEIGRRKAAKKLPQ